MMNSRLVVERLLRSGQVKVLDTKVARLNII